VLPNIAYMRSIGIKIGDGTIIRDKRNISIDISRPELLEIGSNVLLHKGTIILTHDFASICFANADLVITSSFHGTAFALNCGRPLISVIPNDSGDDRQSSLLKSVGANKSIVRIKTNLETINPHYDVEKMSNKLDEFRREALRWIVVNINRK